MALVKRKCAVCGHETRQMVECERDDCELRDDRERMHDHCGHDLAEDWPESGGYQHSLCTPTGCRSVTQSLGLVNPTVGGGMAKAAASPTSLWQVRLARRSMTPGADDRPLTTRFEAELLMFVLTGEKQRVEPVDTSTGIWLVTLPVKMASELQSTGQLLAEHDPYYLEADTP